MLNLQLHLGFQVFGVGFRAHGLRELDSDEQLGSAFSTPKYSLPHYNS